jgi:hypothetical protein
MRRTSTAGLDTASARGELQCLGNGGNRVERLPLGPRRGVLVMGEANDEAIHPQRA